MRDISRRIELENEALKKDFDVLMISESWFDPETPMPALNLVNYELAVTCRREDKHGGTAIYIKNGIPFHNCRIHMEMPHQICSVMIKDLTLVMIYRVGSSTVAQDRALFKELSKVAKRKRIVLMGDLNYAHFPWFAEDPKITSSQRILWNFVEQNDLAQIVENCTRM